MTITESLNPVFDDSNEEVKQLYSDYREKLYELYLRVYEESHRDMTTESHNMYAALEMVFQCFIPSAPEELSMDAESALHYVEMLLKSMMEEDKYSAVLAVTKFIRHKQISLIASASYTEDDILDAIPQAIKEFGKGRINFNEIARKAKEKGMADFKRINDSINGFIDLIEPYYPWDKLDSEKLMNGEYSNPKF